MKPQTFHFIANKCLYSIAVGTNWLIHSCKKKTPKILPIKTRTNNNSNNELELKKTQQVLLRLDVIRFAWTNLFLLWSLSLIFSLIHFQVDFFVEIHGLFVVLFIFFWEIGFVFHEIS